jgi:hypothetical protein
MAGERSERSEPIARHRLVVAIVLIVGWSIAAALYVGAPPPVPEDPDIYDMEHSKKYVRDIERIGGKAAVFTSELNAWVGGLWEGRNRAYTTAGITIVVAAGYLLTQRAARRASEEDEPPGR